MEKNKNLTNLDAAKEVVRETSLTRMEENLARTDARLAAVKHWASHAGQTENSATPDTRWAVAANRAKYTLASFINEDAAREFILHQLHPGQQLTCPGCGAVLEDETTQHNFWVGRRCVCKSCGHWFSATSGTYLQGTQLSFAQLFLLFNLLDISTGEIIPSRIAVAVGVSVDTVRVWKLRLKALSHE